jgi:plastocyanin
MSPSRRAAKRRGRNDGAVLRTTLPLIAVVALVGAACGGPGIVVQSGPTENVFVPQVVDAEGAAGRGISLAVDSDGNPHLAYLAFESQTEPAAAEAADPNAPTLPAVKHAHLIQGLWTRSVVEDDQQALGALDTTAIAVDGEGTHHVVWTEGDTLRYSNNAQGQFSRPRKVADDVIGGISLIAQGGVGVAIAFFQGGGEGPASLVRVAFRQGNGWAVETAAEADRPREPNTGIGFDGDTILVAYGDSGRTMVARSGAIWTSEVADTDGGAGVSMDVDRDGNPHLAYVNSDGTVKHAHTIAGGPWEVTEVGRGGAGLTTIAVDDQGTHHVAWETRRGLGYATNAEGEFRAEEVPGSVGAELPRLGTGPEGAVYLAWYDSEGSEPILAVRSNREPLLAMPTASPTPGGGGTPTGPPPCEPDGTSLPLTAPPGALGTGFDTNCLAAPAGEAVTIDFSNQDTPPHNFSIYRDSSAAERLFEGDIVNAGESTTYEVDPIEEEGQFFFRCDLHPTTMTGTFVVQ